MKRGDIYYIEINDEGVTGHEMMKSRPGIIVSRDDHNEAAETVQVVYCSASQHREPPEHVGIRSTPRPTTWGLPHGTLRYAFGGAEDRAERFDKKIYLL